MSSLALVALVVLLLLFVALALLDLRFELRRQHPIGWWVRTWVRRYPLFAAGLALCVGAFLGHVLH